MARTDAFQIEGTVVEVLPRMMYCVALVNGHRVLAHCKGRAGLKEPALVGDKVILELSPFDLSRGRILGNEK